MDMAKPRRPRSRQGAEDRSESASVDTNATTDPVEEDDSSMTDDKTTDSKATEVETTDESKETKAEAAPAPVTQLHEVEVTFDRYVRSGKSRSLVAAFRADMQGKDKFRVVKRTRKKWDKLWDEFLKAPR